MDKPVNNILQAEKIYIKEISGLNKPFLLTLATSKQLTGITIVNKRTNIFIE